MLNLSYDKQHDILHIKIADNSNSYGAEDENGVNVFRDAETDQITGYMVFGFVSKFVTGADSAELSAHINSLAAPAAM